MFSFHMHNYPSTLLITEEGEGEGAGGKKEGGVG